MIVKRINVFCALLGKSQAQVAKDLGITRLKLNTIVNGKRAIDKLTRKAVLKYFNIDSEVFEKEEITLTLKGDVLKYNKPGPN